jgi:hypothetical protein
MKRSVVVVDALDLCGAVEAEPGLVLAVALSLE